MNDSVTLTLNVEDTLQMKKFINHTSILVAHLEWYLSSGVAELLSRCDARNTVARYDIKME